VPENENSSDSQSPKPGLWDQRKSELEVEKLKTELKYYERTLDLGQQKLRSDLKDWHFRLFSAIATTVIGVATFLAGQAIQRNSDKHKEQLQEVQEQDSEFNRYLSSLGSSEVVQRSLAATALARYVAPETLELPATDWRRRASERRSSEAIAALASRLNTETEILSIEEYSRVLQASGIRALPDVVKANRRAASNFARSAADYVAWNLESPNAYLPEGCENDEENSRNKQNMQAVGKMRDRLVDLVLRSQMPFESDFDGAEIRTAIMARPILDTPILVQRFFRQCRMDLQLAIGLTAAEKSTHQKQAYRELLNSATQLSATSITLVNLLRRSAGSLENTDLSSIYIVNGRLDGLNLTGASLRSSYIAGIAVGFICNSCDLSYADLRQLHIVGQSDFKNAKQEGTKWP
jgi:hypothetical protein